MGIAAVFSGIAVLLFVAGFVTNPLLFFVALPFAGTAYLMWYHASGRLADRLRRAERTGRFGARIAGGSGAGPFDGGPFGSGSRFGSGGRFGNDRGRGFGPRGRARTNRRRAAGAAGGSGRGTGDRWSASGLSRREAYSVLGLSESASIDDVRAAYRKRAKETHPDTDDGDRETFKRVNQAYEVLTD